MITLKTNKADVNKIVAETTKKVEGIKELSSPYTLKEFADAIFTVTSKAFVKAMNIEAKVHPTAYHHIYEWNKVGSNTARLFILEKVSSTGGRLILRTQFKDSRSPVPIPLGMQTPGKSGRFVSARNIFKNKAEIMEKGTPIIYKAKKNLPMFIDGEIKFVAAGTVIRNFNPGGGEVKGAFQHFYETWYATRTNSIINSSGMLRSIQDETAKILNKKGAGAPEVRSTARQTLKQYSRNEAVQ